MTDIEIPLVTLWIVYRAGELVIARESVSAGQGADYPIDDAPGGQCISGELGRVRKKLEERGLVPLEDKVIDTRRGAMEIWCTPKQRALNVLNVRRRVIQL